MSLRDVHGGRALVLRLVLAELIAKRGEGPLAPRFGLHGQKPRPAQRTGEGVQSGLREKEST
jgi:hypothetical protein